MKEDGVGWACSTHEEVRNAHITTVQQKCAHERQDVGSVCS
jgi:hypothetical protein